MPRGITKDGRWRGREPLGQWVRRAQASAPLCGCGCGQQVVVKAAHRSKGIPRYVHGHHARVAHGRYIGVDKWVEANQGKHLCACGCGGAITITAQHHATGIPRYLPNHSPRPRLGHGPAHPAFIADRSRVKSRDGRYFTPWVMKQIRERDGDRCAQCGGEAGLEHDHVVPISLGGSGDPENGQLLCRACHRAKTRVDQMRADLLRQCASLIATIDRALGVSAAAAA